MKEDSKVRCELLMIVYNSVLVIIVFIIILFTSFFSLGSKEQVEQKIISDPSTYFWIRFFPNFSLLVILLSITSGINYLYLRRKKHTSIKVVYHIALYEFVGLNIISIVLILIRISRVH
jgi:cellulose synthase/poly-beta-1,6-N-acetylglucosamine synthase-like glycosyltransferase